MAEFKVGDVVKLKSGGPNMTIEGRTQEYGVTSKTHWHCVWFDGPQNYKEDFSETVLELADDELTEYDD